MNRIAKFEKVSYEQFKKDWIATFPRKFEELEESTVNRIITDIYLNIKLPKRATAGSAGYDFFSPDYFHIDCDCSVTIPTGIRCIMDEEYLLSLYPRSGLGFKYGVSLANTVGIVDSDYAHSSNDGHIFVKMCNESFLGEYKHFVINPGTAFCQGIFTQYGITFDDDVKADRDGGFGSTGA